ncbi:hypothetical protein C8R44DRAFT_894177 [Mycena epipterygia]|nr:hypothetical protein C8R44DRAFT_894177 [Mycena epipterygia]
MTPAFLHAWTLESNVVKPADCVTPDVVKILFSALKTTRALGEKQKKDSTTALYSIIGQLSSRLSQQCSDYAGPMTLFWWKSGCSRECIEILQNLGLSKCFDSTLNIVESLAGYCTEDAGIAALSPGGIMVNWDNVNISTSEFAEQRTEGPFKVQSGTYAVLYRSETPIPARWLLVR